MERAPTLTRLTDGLNISALSQERGQCNAAGQVVLPLKFPWRDCTTHRVTPPLDFMRRLPEPHDPGEAQRAWGNRANANKAAACE